MGPPVPDGTRGTYKDRAGVSVKSTRLEDLVGEGLNHAAFPHAATPIAVAITASMKVRDDMRPPL